MIIHQHESNNAVLAPPPGTTHDEVRALPITRILCGDGTVAVRSYWKPTEEELKLLNEGKAVMLHIWGRTHAPIFIGVDGAPGSEWQQL